MQHLCSKEGHPHLYCQALMRWADPTYINALHEIMIHDEVQGNWVHEPQ